MPTLISVTQVQRNCQLVEVKDKNGELTLAKVVENERSEDFRMLGEFHMNTYQDWGTFLGKIISIKRHCSSLI